MAANTIEVLLKFNGDPRQLQGVINQVRSDLARLSSVQIGSVREAGRQVVTETTRTERQRITETIKSANQRLREEQRAAREVARILAETARQAERQEKIRERAARQLADVQVREAKRAAKELEKSLASPSGAGAGSGGGTVALGLIASRVPLVGNLTSELSALSSASVTAGAAQASLAGPVGIAAAALLAGAAASVAFYKGLFNLAQQTADFQGKLFDMSQQVGVSVETLSALEVLATTTGGSIETITASLGIFQRNLEAAADPTSKEAQLLQQLGVTAINTEGALRQTLKGLFEMGEGAKQTATAMELFGRGGRFVNAILKESEGDLDAAIRKFQELGIIVSTDAAAASDKFNDSLAILQFQIRSITAVIGNEVIPLITKGLADLTRIVNENREAIHLLGIVVRETANAFARTFTEGINFVNLTLARHKPEVLILIQLYERLNRAMGIAASTPPPAAGAPSTPSGIEMLEQVRRLHNASLKPFDLNEIFGVKRGGGRGGGGRSGDAEAQKALQRSREEAELIHREEQERLEELTVANKRELDQQIKDISQFTDDAIHLANLRAVTAIEELNKESQANLKALQKKLLTIQEFNLKEREISLKTRSIVRKNSDETFQLEADRDRQIAQAQLAATQRELQAKERADAREIERIEDRIERGILAESHGQKKIGEILDRGFERRRKALEDEEKSYATSAERRAAINDELVELDNERAFSAERTAQRIIDARNREIAELTPPLGGGQPVPIPETIPINLGIPPQQLLSSLISQAVEAQGAFAGLGTAIAGAFGHVEQAEAFTNTLTTAFGELAHAAGSAVKAFVLFGSAGGGFRKFAAEVIASIASMAVVQAVWEVAQALAMMALTWFTGNPKYAASAGAHWAAAAAYGLVAGVAVPLGRVTAGNTFQQQPEGRIGGAIGAGGGGSSQSSRPTSPTPVNLDRNASQPIFNVLVTVKRDEGSIVEAVVQNHRKNGLIRQMVLEEVRR